MAPALRGPLRAAGVVAATGAAQAILTRVSSQLMSDCCSNDTAAELVRSRQRGTLVSVLAINTAMFVAVTAAALYSMSSALLSDGLDNLGDALTYGLSLYAVSGSDGLKARVALVKGGLILLGACGVAAQIVWKLFVPTVPVFEVMGAFGVLGLAANALCLFLLTRHRNDDVNMSSVWECSRNDVVSNLAVLAAAGAVWFTGSGWPDILVALCLVVFLTRSALRVIVSARREIRVSA